MRLSHTNTRGAAILEGRGQRARSREQVAQQEVHNKRCTFVRLTWVSRGPAPANMPAQLNPQSAAPLASSSDTSMPWSPSRSSREKGTGRLMLGGLGPIKLGSVTFTTTMADTSVARSGP